MPQFTAKPPVFEGRQYEGGEENTTQILGWLLANDMDASHYDAVGVEGDENFVAEHFVIEGQDVLASGQWLLLLPAAYQILDASELYKNYTQAP